MARISVRARSGAKPEPEVQWHCADRLPPGEYRAISRKSTIYFDRQFRRHVCATQFDVFGDSMIERIARCTWYLNLGTKEKPHSGRRSLYWRAWSKANGGVPKRHDRMSPRVFERRCALIRIEDTTKTFLQASVDENTAYSVVRDVIEWETGSNNHSDHTSRQGTSSLMREKGF